MKDLWGTAIFQWRQWDCPWKSPLCRLAQTHRPEVDLCKCMQITRKWTSPFCGSFQYLKETPGITLLEIQACTVRKMDKMIPILISATVYVCPQASQTLRFSSGTLNRTMRLTKERKRIADKAYPSQPPRVPSNKAMKQSPGRHMEIHPSEMGLQGVASNQTPCLPEM